MEILKNYVGGGVHTVRVFKVPAANVRCVIVPFTVYLFRERSYVPSTCT